MTRLVIGMVAVFGLACSSLPPSVSGRVDPRVTLELLAITQDPSGKITATLPLTNGSEQAFTYRGYSVEQPSNSSTTEVWHGLRWKTNLLVGCGTGVRTVSLSPGRNVTFPLQIWTRDIRGGTYTRFRAVLREEEGDRVVRSRPFRVPAPDVRLHRTATASPPNV